METKKGVKKYTKNEAIKAKKITRKNKTKGHKKSQQKVHNTLGQKKPQKTQKCGK